MKNFYLALLFIVFIPGGLHGQPRTIPRDSLNLMISKEAFLDQDTNTVNLYNLITISYEYIYNSPDSALLWNKKAIALANRLNFKPGLADAYYNLAIYYNAKEDYTTTAEQLQKAIEYYSASNTIASIQGIARVYMQQSVVEYNLKHFKEAIRSVEDGIKIMEKYNLQPLTTLIYLKGVYLVEDHQYARALPYLQEALKLRLAEKNSKPSRISEARLYLGEAYGKLGDRQKAQEYFQQAYKIAYSVNDKDGISMITFKEGEFYFNIKNYVEAEKDLMKAMSITTNIDRRLRILQLLAELYSVTGRYKEAYSKLDEYIELNRNTNIDNLTKQIAALRTKSDIAKKESEIALLEQKTRNDQLIKYGLLIVSILVFTTAIISYKRFTFKRDANKKLSQANQELMQTLEDLQLAEQQLLQAEKMASLGRVTAGIAHELRNPLNFIHNFAAVAGETVDEFLQAEPDNRKLLADDLKTSIDKIKLHGNKAEQIITTMLRHGKDKVLDTEAVSLNELIDESIAIATKNFSFKHEGFQCKVDLDEENPDIRLRVNSKSIPLVIGNLIDNAMYSVMQKSKNLSAGFFPQVKLHQELNEKGLLLEIEDNGLGLPEQKKSEIFEPFYTTKPTGHGTGLGLSICYEILKAHGASINVKNNEFGGATFSIHFPNTLILT